MSKWKRQVAAINAMGRGCAAKNAPSIVAKERAERVNQLVQRMKERFNANADNL
jgi:hypothetical protein